MGEALGSRANAASTAPSAQSSRGLRCWRRRTATSWRSTSAETGETLTEAVVIALRERLAREHARHGASMRMQLTRLAADVAALPVADGRTPEEIIGYDDSGLPS